MASFRMLFNKTHIANNHMFYVTIIFNGFSNNNDIFEGTN
jgi:hypothetical protein